MKVSVVEELRLAKNFVRRLKGLLGTSGLPEKTGLLLEPCDSIHTWGMRYSIDALFLDEENRVLDIGHNLPPNTWGKRVKGARKVLEIQAGRAKQLQIQSGDEILLTGKGEGNH